MARGHQKIQSQKKNQERQAKQKKQTDHKAAAKKALVHTCPICRANLEIGQTFCYIALLNGEGHLGDDLLSMGIFAQRQLGAKTFNCNDHHPPMVKTQMPDPKTYKQHFQSKHPKAPLPDELKDVVA